MNSKFCRVVVFLVLSWTPVWAQNPPEPGKSGFRTLGWMVSQDDLYYDLAGQDTKLSIIEATRSAFSEIPKDAKKLVFYRLVPGPKDKPVREEAASVDLSGTGPWPLLIFMANPEAPKHYRVAAIADDLKVFPFPSCRFVNFTPVELDVTYGDQKIKVPAKGIERVDIRTKSSNESETRFATVSMKTPEGPRLLYTNNWVVNPSQRTLAFIFSQDKLFQIICIEDHISLYTPPPPTR